MVLESVKNHDLEGCKMYSPAKTPAASATNRSWPPHCHLAICNPTFDLAILPRHLLMVDQTADKFIQPIQQFAT